MTPPDWLSEIALITFDCFGTLLDWRAGLAKVDIASDEDFAIFEAECASQAEGDRHVPYHMILKQTIRKMRPDMRPAIIGLFADDFGRLPAFPDSAGALASLKHMVKVGVLSNCDANHQLDVISTLHVAWDVCVTSQELRAYKPTDRAWDAILRMGVARTAVPRSNWLHVSAFQRYDLGPARARGLRTCLVRRPGGDDKAPCDLVVSGLDELAALTAEAKQGPVLLEITNVSADAATRDRLRSWLSDSRLAQMREIAGVREARLIEMPEGELVEQYTFGGKIEYDGYVEAFEAEHRSAVKTRFADALQRSVRTATVRARA